jgi:DNA topoisomerase-1
MAVLIIAEKPSVALRIAIALGNNRQKRLVLNGVSYYQIDEGKSTTYIAAAVGHLFTIRQSGAKYGYPVLDVTWAPSYEVNKEAYYTKKYVDVFKELASKADTFINACDYDTEGTVIGVNIIRFLCSGMGNARRMKFSTTTIPDLVDAYANIMPMDMNNFYAGEARHMLDWLWGINLSRALTSALAESRFKRTLSIGRVQGPALAMLAQREMEIAKFVPKPFWRVFALISGIEFANTRGDIFERKIADDALAVTKAHSGEALVESVEANEQLMRPYPPFDLTTLQLEASRTLRSDPSDTLALAQSLYEKAYISYPRTSSQKLPATLGLPKIIGELAKNPAYAALANRLIAEKRFRPNEGFKSDEAHPAIYPTGVAPKGLTVKEEKLYDLIAKRFLACFAAYAKLSRTKAVVTMGGERYVANGTTILERGWLEFYEFARLDEKLLPVLNKGSSVTVDKSYLNELMTQAPKRYGKAMLIAELERRQLGTKATRAQIIDTLFKRSYVEGTSIHVTDFGMSVFNALKEYSPMIVDESTTKALEEDMEKIVKGEKSSSEVVEEGKQMLLSALQMFDKNKAEIAQAMSKVLQENEVVLGKCPSDGGDLVIKRSRIGKIFAACANYPKCTVTYSLPQDAKIEPTGKVCEHCHTPIVKVMRRSRGVFEMCLDSKCITKKGWKSNKEAKVEAVAANEISKKAAAKGKAPVKITEAPMTGVAANAVQVAEKVTKAEVHNPVAKETPVAESGAVKKSIKKEAIITESSILKKKQGKPKSAGKRAKPKAKK